MSGWQPRTEILRLAVDAANLASDLVSRVPANDAADHDILVAIAQQIRGAANRLRELRRVGE